MSFAEAALSIEELAEEIARANAERYAFARMLAATDGILAALEEMNRDGVKATSFPDRAGWRETLHELPSAVIGPWPVEQPVQQLLDGLFEVQERLLHWHDPQRSTDEEEA